MTENERDLISQLLDRGVENIYPSREFLEGELSSGRRLTIYLGVDPSSPTLHIGHAIPLRKLALFQKLGHQIIFLIGDFTAMIGDPDKLSARVPLTREEVLANAEAYQDQVSGIIDFGGENPAVMRWNSEWLSELTMAEAVSLTSHFTVQQMLERDMFQKRIGEGRPVYMHELLYPLMQGYDSLAMKVDGEVGGNDQTFNMLVGRTLVRQVEGREKFVVTTKLLTDPSGAKMGKTTGNMLALADSPEDMFGKVMSWTDGMIVSGFELCTDVSLESIKDIQKEIEGGANPRDAKLMLAYEIVKSFKGEEAAVIGREHFENTIQKKGIPLDIPIHRTPSSALLTHILADAGLAKSKTDARRLVEEGAVSVYLEGESEKITDPAREISSPVTLKIGKHRFLRVEIG